MSETAEIVVVGAGIVGAAVALELAGRGHDVLVLEQGIPGGAVSGASLACISTHMIDHDELALLSWSRDAWRELNDRFGGFEYGACGQLRFILRQEDIAVAQRWIEAERAAGLDPELLDPVQAREVEPLLTGPILAASWSKGDAVVNPFLAVRMFLSNARKHGARFTAHCPVEALIERDGRMRGMRTANGDVSAEHVVLAAGPWTARIARSIALALEIRPRKAQCLATVRIPPSIRGVVGACESAGGVEAGYTQIQQAKSGQVLFNTVLAGGLSEDGAQDHVPEVDADFVRDSVETLLRLFPSLSTVNLLRSWVRFEAVTPDDRFLIGPAGPEGLWIAAGDCGTGFVRAPAIARLVARMIVQESPELDPAIYAPERFAASKEGAA